MSREFIPHPVAASSKPITSLQQNAPDGTIFFNKDKSKLYIYNDGWKHIHGFNQITENKNMFLTKLDMVDDIKIKKDGNTVPCNISFDVETIEQLIPGIILTTYDYKTNIMKTIKYDVINDSTIVLRCKEQEPIKIGDKLKLINNCKIIVGTAVSISQNDIIMSVDSMPSGDILVYGVLDCIKKCVDIEKLAPLLVLSVQNINDKVNKIASLFNIE